MADPFILTTPGFKLIKEDFNGAIQEGPTYEFRRNVIKLAESKFQTDIYNKCTAGKSD